MNKKDIIKTIKSKYNINTNFYYILKWVKRIIIKKIRNQ
jgi:hypothetical protein